MQLMHIQNTQNTKENISHNEVVYNSDFVKITDKTYRKLLDFFKTNKEIKSVWIQGSRVFGVTRNGYDVDLIID